MSEAKHIPGPWRVDSYGPPAIWAKTRSGDMKIADVRGWGHLTGIGTMKLPEEEAEEIQDANARLMSAAPELLEALKSLASEYEGVEDMLPADGIAKLNAVRAVIAKPEGRA